MITKINEFLKYKLNETHENGYMHINEFSMAMTSFYDFINSIMPLLDKKTKFSLVESFKYLNNAWRYECDEHGVNFSKYNNHPEKKEYFEINEFSEHFIEFYDFIKNNLKYMGENTIKELKIAFKCLDEAWMTECEEHGVDFEQYSIDFNFESTNESKKSKEKIKGGLADGMSLSDIAKKHDIKLGILRIQYHKGLKVEMEHTSSKNTAAEIVKDHLFEDPKYYSKLQKIEKD